MIDATFLYFACWSRHVMPIAKGLVSGSTPSRQRVDPSAFSQIVVPVPDAISEQRAIAAVLGKLQAAVAAQQAIIDRTAELKAALMAKLFTEGTRGEPTKETVSGIVPISWGSKPLGDAIEPPQYGLSVRGEAAGRYPILRMNCQRNGRVAFDDLQYVDIDDRTFAAYKLRRGDILFNRTNSADLVGRTAIFDDDRDAVFASYLIRMQPRRDELLPAYLNHYLNWERTQQRLKAIATRGVSQSNISAGKLKIFDVAFPTPDEQEEIAGALGAVDQRIAFAEAQRELSHELFAAMLDELMTGRIRVNELDLAALGVSADA
ncbi:MAG: hypothetical protein DCC68_13385 [Planctomycetota bacterium]|nr:MAG: hypothetical protein DCC68_13385 [Planctomycetota bacterium]